MKRILFLCSGNYYRSRFAEILFNWHATQRGLAWRAESRGLALDARNAGPVSQYTIAGLHERQIPLATCERLPIAATAEDFQSAQRVIAVKEAEHRAMVERHHPTFRHQVEYWHVHDLDCAMPQHALAHLEREVLSLLATLDAAAA
jgi:protein-tyrosine phosphatase